MNERIEKLAEDAINSFNGAERAQPKPFLFTRVMAAIHNRKDVDSTWTKIGAFISRPSVAFAGLVLIIALNASIVFIENNKRGDNPVSQANNANRDEFAINTATIYDVENPEQ